jgi:multidrug efflux pump subunit AcrA (membrane-fusion protein)
VAAPVADGRPSRRRLLTRLVMPAGLLLGFAVLVAVAARDVLDPPRPVTVVPVLGVRAELSPPAGTPLFRAAGWVEPRPTPTVVTALAEGVLERLFVVEGQEVQEGDLIARLNPTEAALALAAAEAEVQLRSGELAAARVTLTAARARLAQPLHLLAEVAEADSQVARAETELANVPHLLRAAQARQRFARTDWESKQRATTAVPEISLHQSRSELEAADAAVEELLTRQKRLPVEVALLKARRDVLAQKVELKTEEVRQVGEAEAAVLVAEARLRQVEALRDAARLRRERMEVRSPASGRVLAVPARPRCRSVWTCGWMTWAGSSPARRCKSSRRPCPGSRWPARCCGPRRRPTCRRTRYRSRWPSPTRRRACGRTCSAR